MGVAQGDVRIRVAIKLILEEMRKNPWLIDDIFSELVQDPYLSEYGQKEIDHAKEWFLNNKIEVLNKYTLSNQDYPCVTISMGESSEDDRESTLADLSPEVDELQPSQINKPIPYIVKPFTPTGYSDGLMTLNESTEDVAPGMLIVDPATGDSWEIIELVGADGIRIKDSPALTASKFGIVPEHRYYRARRERAGFRESYQIGCHVHGDPNQLLWLWSIVLYGILRYRETLLSGRCFQISSVKSTDIIRENAFAEGGENAYKRYIILSGLVQNSWLKSPNRVIEKAKLKDPDGVTTGLKILTDTATPIEAADPEKDDNWLTKQQSKSFKKKTLTMKG